MEKHLIFHGSKALGELLFGQLETEDFLLLKCPCYLMTIPPDYG